MPIGLWAGTISIQAEALAYKGFRTKNLEYSLFLFRQAAETAPHLYWLKKIPASVQIRLGQNATHDAVWDLQRALGNDPYSADILAALALHAARIEDYSLAKDAFLRLELLAPQAPLVRAVRKN